MTRLILTTIMILLPLGILLTNDSSAFTTKGGVCIIREIETDSVETFNVDATIYYPTGNPTASTKRIPKNYKLDTHRWCALSRNLLSRWGGEFDYGDTIVVEGIHEDVDGMFIVRDAINARYKDRIDILVKPTNSLYGKWDNVIIKKYGSTRVYSE